MSTKHWWNHTDRRIPNYTCFSPNNSVLACQHPIFSIQLLVHAVSTEGQTFETWGISQKERPFENHGALDRQRDLTILFL